MEHDLPKSEYWTYLLQYFGQPPDVRLTREMNGIDDEFSILSDAFQLRFRESSRVAVRIQSDFFQLVKSRRDEQFAFHRLALLIYV